MRKLFRAHDGRIHLFWRLLSYTFFYMALMAVAMFVQEKVLHQPRTTIAGALFYTGVMVTGTWWLTRAFRRRADRRPWGGMALPSLRRGNIGLLLLGFTAGLVLFGLVFGVERYAGLLEVTGFEAARSGLSGAITFLVAGLLYDLTPGFTEEVVMRGYWFQNIGEGRPVWISTLIMGIFFALMHFGEIGPRMLIFIPSVLIISTALVMTRLLTGSLWLAIGWHTAWNFAQHYVFGISAVGLGLHPWVAAKLTGPAWLVGAPGMPEEGLVGIAAELLGVALLLGWMAWRRKRIDWRAVLTAEGHLETAPAPQRLSA
jgi:membrane protease YdiL (CAAX protease family)